MKLKKTLNKKNTPIESLEFEKKKNDLNEKLNFYEYDKIDMDCKIKELIVDEEDLIEKN